MLLLLLLKLCGVGVLVVLELRRVGVLMVDGGLLWGLAGEVGGDGVLLHWDWRGVSEGLREEEVVLIVVE